MPNEAEKKLFVKPEKGFLDKIHKLFKKAITQLFQEKMLSNPALKKIFDESGSENLPPAILEAVGLRVHGEKYEITFAQLDKEAQAQLNELLKPQLEEAWPFPSFAHSFGQGLTLLGESVVQEDGSLLINDDAIISLKIATVNSWFAALAHSMPAA